MTPSFWCETLGQLAHVREPVVRQYIEIGLGGGELYRIALIS